MFTPLLFKSELENDFGSIIILRISDHKGISRIHTR